MRHYTIKGGDNRHYCVGHNGQGGVLIQLGEDVVDEFTNGVVVSVDHVQVRVCLTVEEADHMIGLLQRARAKAVEYEGQEQAEPRTPETVEVSGMQGVDGKGQEAVSNVQA